MPFLGISLNGFVLLCGFFFPNRLHSDVSLSLVMDQKYPSVSPTKCQCHVIMLKNSNLAESTSHWQLEPLPKRMKLECLNGKECTGASLQRKANESRTFTAVANLAPFLAFHRAFCMILLHAKRRKESKDENVQKNKTLTLLCGKIVLNAAEILSGIHSVNNNDYKYTGKFKFNTKQFKKENLFSCSLLSSTMPAIYQLCFSVQ